MWFMGLSLTVELFGYNVAILKIQDHVTPSFPYNTLKTSVYLWQYTRLSVTSEKAFVTVTFHAPFLRKLLESIYQPNKINKSGTGIQKTRDGDTVVKPGDKPHEASPQNGREMDERSGFLVFWDVPLKRRRCEVASCDVHRMYCGEDAMVHANADF